MIKNKLYVLAIGILLGILLIELVMAAAPIWVGSTRNYSINEDTPYYHNLSANITPYTTEVTFEIDTETAISWNNGSDTVDYAKADISWISIISSLLGNLSISATENSQTGFFVVPIQATNTTDSDAAVTNFEFIINATNDAPNFTTIETEYNLTRNISFSQSIIASDEEEHYPLQFNISFINR